jgi:hypothetical protein
MFGFGRMKEQSCLRAFLHQAFHDASHHGQPRLATAVRAERHSTRGLSRSRVLESTDFHAGCAVVGVITGAHDADLLDRGAAAFNDARDALAAQFQKTGSTATDAAERATLLICAAEGAVLLARARRSIEPLELIAEQLHGGPD